MPGMQHGAHGANLDPLTWSSFFSTWSLGAGWLLAALVLGLGYAALRRRAVARDRSTVRGWRAGSFLVGCLLLWAIPASAIGGYSMTVFWMHMTLHLLLIMVVPALLVLGHPITTVVEALEESTAARVRTALRSRTVTVLTHPVVGFAVYATVIIGTHLTGFMDQMAQHGWLMGGEQVLYVVAGYLYLLPLIGDEPIGWSAPYLARLMLLLVGMVPDTIVGIVLLQTSTNPYPVMLGDPPTWAPDAVRDVQIAGGLMWAAGDGLMMFLGVGLMIAVITSPTRRLRMTGSWIDGVRRSVVTAGDSGSGTITDADSEDALAAYNRMLARLDREHPGR